VSIPHDLPSAFVIALERAGTLHYVFIDRSARLMVCSTTVAKVLK
jgi:hypothetical protein